MVQAIFVEWNFILFHHWATVNRTYLTAISSSCLDACPLKFDLLAIHRNRHSQKLGLCIPIYMVTLSASKSLLCALYSNLNMTPGGQSHRSLTMPETSPGRKKNFMQAEQQVRQQTITRASRHAALYINRRTAGQLAQIR